MIFSASRRPLAPEANPYALYDRLFTAKGDILRAERKSAIDLVKAELDALKGKVSTEDRPKMEAHLDSVRAIEKRLTINTAQCQGRAMPAALVTPTRLDPNAADNIPWTFDRQSELLALALACDATRFASIQYTVGDNDNMTYKWLGQVQGHHAITHAPDADLAAKDSLAKIYTWYAERFAHLLASLDAVPEGAGTMLDNSIVVWGSELGKGNSHSFKNTPFVIAGGAGGALRTGRFLDFPAGAMHSRLLVSLCHLMGVPVDKFGNTDTGSGPLPRLV